MDVAAAGPTHAGARRFVDHAYRRGRWSGRASWPSSSARTYSVSATHLRRVLPRARARRIARRATARHALARPRKGQLCPHRARDEVQDHEGAHTKWGQPRPDCPRVEIRSMMAVQWQRLVPGFLHRSDCGPQGAAEAYAGRLAALEAVASMSGTGNRYDNALMESLLASPPFGSIRWNWSWSVSGAGRPGKKRGEICSLTSRATAIAPARIRRSAVARPRKTRIVWRANYRCPPERGRIIHRSR